jgi:hypothetical protein
MRKIIHKLIRYSRGGLNVVADVNAAISTANDGVSSSSVRSYSRIIQRNGRTWNESDTQPPKEKEVTHVEGDS